MRFLLRVQHVSRLVRRTQAFASRVPTLNWVAILSILSVASVRMLQGSGQGKRQSQGFRRGNLCMALTLRFSTRPANLARTSSTSRTANG